MGFSHLGLDNLIHGNPLAYSKMRTAVLCAMVYIDMGTNIGHQIRKVFEPHLYQGNPTESIFERYFGKNREDVCVFGFEANPIHSSRLKALEHAYRNQGYEVTIHTETAVSTRAGDVSFYRDPGASIHNEWGAGLTLDIVADKANPIIVNVSAIDMAEWMRVHIPLSAVVVMKSDIEGHDETVLSHLYSHNQLCRVSAVYGEHMSSEWFSNTLNKLANDGCKTEMIMLDDESGNDNLPLPSMRKNL